MRDRILFQATFSCLLLLVLFAALAHAEDKYDTSMMVPKLTAAETADGPSLTGGAYVYPSWGAPCTNFTYRVTYSDRQGRAPAYVRIWLNGAWHDMAKVRGDYTTGALYEYYYVPNSGKGNFYYFEASNGAGKARGGMIDSPNQGPLMYSSKFDSNQVILLKKESNVPVWVYETGKDMPSHVALSADSKYLAAATADAVYLFSTANGTPLWRFCIRCTEPSMPLSNHGGVALSSDGSRVAAAIGGTLYLFGRESNQAIWSADIESGAIGLDMSDDGQYVAVGTGNSGEKGDSIFFFGSDGQLLWKYRAVHPGYVQTGNFYRPDITPDGSYVAVSTGCPDRRAYLFSNNGTIAFRSEQLTTDSPVHKSAISDDASLVAYSLDHAQGKEILMLFSKGGSKLWGFSSSQDSTARAVSMSADGRLIATGTTVGNLYLFSKNSNVPLWKFTAKSSTQLNHIGDVKLSPDGNYLVAGGTGKKVYFFSTASAVPLWEYDAKEWINSVDYAAGYVAAATGMDEFAFEGNEVGDEPVACSAIIQPPASPEFGDNMGKNVLAPEAGECFCMPGETCPENCVPSQDAEGTNGNSTFPPMNGTAPRPGNGINQPAPGTGCIYEDCAGSSGAQGAAAQPDNASGGNISMWKAPGKENQTAGGQEQKQQTSGTAPKAQEPSQEPKEAAIPRCSGALDSLWGFLSSLFGNRYCS